MLPVLRSCGLGWQVQVKKKSSQIISKKNVGNPHHSGFEMACYMFPQLQLCCHAMGAEAFFISRCLEYPQSFAMNLDKGQKLDLVTKRLYCLGAPKAGILNKILFHSYLCFSSLSHFFCAHGIRKEYPHISPHNLRSLEGSDRMHYSSSSEPGRRDFHGGPKKTKPKPKHHARTEIFGFPT